MQQVVAVGHQHRHIGRVGIGLVGLRLDGRALHRGERRHDGHVLHRDEGNHHVAVVGEELVGLQLVGPAHDLRAGGVTLHDVLVVVALLGNLDVEEVGEQAVGHHVVLVGGAPALLEVEGHVRPGEGHVVAGRVEVVLHEPVHALDVAAELAAQVLDHGESVGFHLLVERRRDDQAVGLRGDRRRGLDRGLHEIRVVDDHALDLVLVTLHHRRESGVGLRLVQRQRLLRDVRQHAVEPELPHLRHRRRADLPAAVVILAAAVHHVHLLFAVAIDDALQADGRHLAFDIVVLKVHHHERSGRGLHLGIETVGQIDVERRRTDAAAARIAALAAGQRQQAKQRTEAVSQRAFHWF